MNTSMATASCATQVSVPLAAGEQWANKWEFRHAIEEELIDYARTDICICGGLTEAKKIAAMAETHLIKILAHNPLGPICTAASLHLDLACDNAGPQEVVFPPAQMLPDVFECAFKLEGTRADCPDSARHWREFNTRRGKKISRRDDRASALQARRWIVYQLLMSRHESNEEPRKRGTPNLRRLEFRVYAVRQSDAIILR